VAETKVNALNSPTAGVDVAGGGNQQHPTLERAAEPALDQGALVDRTGLRRSSPCIATFLEIQINRVDAGDEFKM
jgi:hypothetical protein